MAKSALLCSYSLSNLWYNVAIIRSQPLKLGLVSTAYFPLPHKHNLRRRHSNHVIESAFYFLPKPSNSGDGWSKENIAELKVVELEEDTIALLTRGSCTIYFYLDCEKFCESVPHKDKMLQ